MSFYENICTPYRKSRWRTNLQINTDELGWSFIAEPGDTVSYQGDSMVVGEISLAVSDQMELVELGVA